MSQELSETVLTTMSNNQPNSCYLINEKALYLPPICSFSMVGARVVAERI